MQIFLAIIHLDLQSLCVCVFEFGASSWNTICFKLESLIVNIKQNTKIVSDFSVYSKIKTGYGLFLKWLRNGSLSKYTVNQNKFIQNVVFF